ncbi:Pituitary tumor-transforming protein 1 protein-interacting protein [Bulinus truncatus]|nr:Pituitary tumor-transforming protein 1 protein-interacting protein [Bulinus truncatus]
MKGARAGEAKFCDIGGIFGAASNMKPAIYTVLGLVLIFSANAETNSTSTVVTTTLKSTTGMTTTYSPEQDCAKHNGSCDECVKNAKCLYCYSDDSCMLYPVGKVLPPSSLCSLSKARWGVCWVNFEALIISMGVIGGIIILTITCTCVYCCCCRGNNKQKYDKDDAKFESQKMERKAKQDERRAERKGKLDEIRRKYGLVKDDAPYQRFDA